MPPKPQSLIPDTVTVIRLHELGLWQTLCEQVDVLVPSIVARVEARCYPDSTSGEYEPIRLEDEIGRGAITEVSASTEAMASFKDHFDTIIKQRLDDGELEALTYLWEHRHEECLFCSADHAAIKALVLVGLGHKGISLERALASAGLTVTDIGGQYCEERFKEWVRDATIDRIQGTGLAGDPPGSRA